MLRLNVLESSVFASTLLSDRNPHLLHCLVCLSAAHAESDEAEQMRLLLGARMYLVRGIRLVHQTFIARARKLGIPKQEMEELLADQLNQAEAQMCIQDFVIQPSQMGVGEFVDKVLLTNKSPFDGDGLERALRYMAAIECDTNPRVICRRLLDVQTNLAAALIDLTGAIKAMVQDFGFSNGGKDMDHEVQSLGSSLLGFQMHMRSLAR